MKGSAITGPVAKECVRNRMYFFRLTMLMCNNPGGLMASYCVERRHSSLGSSNPLHSRLPSDQIVMSCIFKMPIHRVKIVMTIIQSRPESILILQSRCCRVSDTGISVALQQQIVHPKSITVIEQS